MGRLRGIDIVGITAVKTDDLNEDEVYYVSFLRCGADARRSGQAPDAEVARSNAGMLRSQTPIACAQGVAVTPPADWGRLFPANDQHERCCDDGRAFVSGSVYFFDSEDPPIGLKILGAVLITVVAAAVFMVIAVAFAPVSLTSVIGAAAGGIAVWAALAMVWQQFIRKIGRDDYLGGVQLNFPCGGSQAVEQQHHLHGGAAGIQSVRLPGRLRARWSGSSAEYQVTFRATYT